MAIPVHVVSKSDNAQHAVCRSDEKHTALAASSVRVQTWMISLTSNNLTYARSGVELHWWDVYPVPESSPVPFNNRQEWGIVPAWGYGRVLETTIDAVAVGSLLWGMWPTSAHAVDLQLTAAEPNGHWSEISPHRSQLMTVYNQYEQTDALNQADMRTTALCKPLWLGPSLLNSSVFSSQRIHPFGFGAPWSEQDADLSSAVVISLSASSKTGRSFSWELARNRDVTAHGPLALLQFTSAPHMLLSYHTLLPIKSVSYGGHDAIIWIEQFKPARVVIFDFGASDSVLKSLLSAMSRVTDAVTVIGIGYEAKVYTADELQARMATGNINVRVNTSGLRDHAIASIGPDEFFRRSNETWNRCLNEKAFENVQVRVLRAIDGPQGIEGAWSDLCNRKVPANLGTIIDLSQD